MRRPATSLAARRSSNSTCLTSAPSAASYPARAWWPSPPSLPPLPGWRSSKPPGQRAGPFCRRHRPRLRPPHSVGSTCGWRVLARIHQSRSYRTAQRWQNDTAQRWRPRGGRMIRRPLGSAVRTRLMESRMMSPRTNVKQWRRRAKTKRWRPRRCKAAPWQQAALPPTAAAAPVKSGNLNVDYKYEMTVHFNQFRSGCAARRMLLSGSLSASDCNGNFPGP